VDVADTHSFAAVPGQVPSVEPAPGLVSRLGLELALPQEAFDRVTRMLAAELGVARAVLVLHDGAGRNDLADAVAGDGGQDDDADGRGGGKTARVDDGAGDGIVLSHHRSQASPDAGPVERAAAVLDGSAFSHAKAIDEPLLDARWAIAPVFCERRHVGSLWAIAGSRRDWGTHDLAVLCDLAAIAGSELDLRSALHDRDRAEIALQDSERNIRKAFDLASIGMVVGSLDPRSAGTLVRVNQAACEFFGRAEHELVGLHFLDITHPDDCVLSEALLDSLMNGERRVVRRVEKRYLHGDGHTIWGELTTSVIESIGGRPPYLISIVEDITERKQAELDLPAIANVVRRILSGDDARLAIVQAALDIAGASSAHLAERSDADTLEVTASAGLNLLGVEVKLSEPSATARAFVTGEPRFLADPSSDPLVSRELVEMSRARSIMWQPIRSHGGVIGVLCVCWSAPIHGISARAARAVALLTDETAVALSHHEALEQLAAQATVDPLTSLPNRRAWDERLAHELAAAARRETPVTLGLLDIDRLRAWNDEHGHAAGDRLLCNFAVRARPLLRQVDMLARWRGGEFAILLPDCPTAAFPSSVLDRIRGAVPSGRSCSVGYATWNRTETAEHLIHRARRALLRAKETGGDRAVAAEGRHDA
jgi:diguanylate cyclase (GGDEF)-like protein/PAS domain S-box-containing protein